jgi:hypothetical protein
LLGIVEILVYSIFIVISLKVILPKI